MAILKKIMFLNNVKKIINMNYKIYIYVFIYVYGIKN